jgi:hypothetical protein
MLNADIIHPSQPACIHKANRPQTHDPSEPYIVFHSEWKRPCRDVKEEGTSHDGNKSASQPIQSVQFQAKLQKHCAMNQTNKPSANQTPCFSPLLDGGHVYDVGHG